MWRGHVEQGRAGSRLPQPCHPQEKGTARSSHTYTPKSETLVDNRLWSPTPTTVTGGFAPVSAPTGTTRGDNSSKHHWRWWSLSGSRADNHSADNLLSHDRYRGETINAGGDYWLSHSQSSSGKLAILQGQIIPSSKKRETIGTLVSINGSHSRRGKGVGWVAFPPPHITVCFFSHRWGRASLLQQPPSHCGARAPRVDRTQDGIIDKLTKRQQQDKKTGIAEKNSYQLLRTARSWWRTIHGTAAHQNVERPRILLPTLTGTPTL